MNNNYSTKFGISIDKHSEGMWSFGIALSHFVKETYLYINLFKWSISIGFLYIAEEEFFVDDLG